MSSPTPAKSSWLWLEWLFAAGIVALLVRAGLYLWDYGYLPQPFFYDPTDTFMDWFNPVYWSHHTGEYDDWRAIYPPLSFVITSFLSIKRCYTGSMAAGEARDCDWVGFVVIGTFFALNAVLIAMTYRKMDRASAWPRSFALAFSLPMLWALERGNILLICFTCFLLGFGPLLASARSRWLFVGLAINFKVYLIATLGVQLARRRWRWVEGALIATVLVYLVTFAIVGDGTPLQIYRNIVDFAESFGGTSVLDMWMAITYQPLTSILQGQNFPVMTLVGSEVLEIGSVVLPILTHAGQLMVILAAIATALRPEVVPVHRVAFLGTALALISSEAGGYTEIFLIFFVFLERWRGIGRPVAILLAYLLCLPGEILFGTVPPSVQESFLGGRPVEMHLGIGIGMFLRPGVVLFIAVALSLTTIRAVWQDIRVQGWAGRWRFRHDWALLPGVLPPRGKADHAGPDTTVPDVPPELAV